MRKRGFIILIGVLSSLAVWAEARFPKPDFTSGYQYPVILHGAPNEMFWNVVDIVMLIGMMSLVVWGAYRKRSRAVIYSLSVVSVLYFGFFRSGCVCSVGSIQNVVLSLVSPDYHLPWYVLLVFLLPILFALLFGRVFCAGVCPLGALQELVNIRNFRLARSVSVALSVIPWIYLAFTILYAATRSQFLICRLDPFVGIFRLGGDMGMITFGIGLLLMSVFIGRPFCRFLCPYGALLSVFSSLSWKKLEITPRGCINCALCGMSCPVDAIRSPQSSRTGEERRKGVNRIILFAALLPLLTMAGAFLVGGQSDALSLAHKDVYLYELLLQQQARPDMEVPLEVETFNALGGNIEELKARVDEVRLDYRFYTRLAGALIGFIIGFKLLKLSLKRSRKTYEVSSAHCTMCGRCFSYCPQNINIKKHEKTIS
ncbi:MAG: 4Fe-4S binding protein [Bacteroidaceae bacterium]|nr:4Fe-4S binding protein [Bacteroidaceae bacterium]